MEAVGKIPLPILCIIVHSHLCSAFFNQHWSSVLVTECCQTTSQSLLATSSSRESPGSFRDREKRWDCAFFQTLPLLEMCGGSAVLWGREILGNLPPPYTHSSGTVADWFLPVGFQLRPAASLSPLSPSLRGFCFSARLPLPPSYCPWGNCPLITTITICTHFIKLILLRTGFLCRRAQLGAHSFSSA